MGARSAIWMNNVNPIFNLEKIELTSCLECETLPPFGQLPFLKSLKLVWMLKVKWPKSKFNGNDKYRVFPLLDVLHIFKLKALEDWFEAGVAAEDGRLFPCLIELDLSYCPKLKDLPSKKSSRRLRLDQILVLAEIARLRDFLRLEQTSSSDESRFRKFSEDGARGDAWRASSFGDECDLLRTKPLALGIRLYPSPAPLSRSSLSIPTLSSDLASQEGVRRRPLPAREAPARSRLDRARSPSSRSPYPTLTARTDLDFASAVFAWTERAFPCRVSISLFLSYLISHFFWFFFFFFH
ncbi:Putative disease resistance protein [Dendrobium catenatum]|uniref:Disease resistance protein n=1 Tax=Dendrobium catenatum TaxID=906689 RepID=A0A2I0VIC2_9ASPA|nr:Putative disease resistance protein [Dendrobium catenatum]